MKLRINKKLICAALILLLSIIAIFSYFLNQNVNIANASQNSELYDKLCQLDGVHDIQPIETEKFQEKYVFKIAQPIDWNNPQGKKIDQRVIISFNGFDKYNVLETEGYYLKDRVLSGDWIDEIVEHYTTNQINVEHRFFGESIPEGLNNKEIKNWEYLTCENEAKDLHRIYTELAKILPNKWISTGASKGGETTMLYGYYFPEDMDLYLPYVAPWSIPNDTRAYDFIWTKAGDERYGKEQAAKYRQLMDDIMVDFYTYRDDIRDRFINERLSQIFYVNDFFKDRTEKILYDQSVLEFTFTTWQYDQEFEKIQQIHDMSWTTQHDEKVEALLNLISDPATNKIFKLYKKSITNDEDVDYPYFAYELQAWEEQGYYLYDTQHLKNLLDQRVIKTGMEIKEGEAIDLSAHLHLHENFIKAFPYDPTTHNCLIKWWNTTNQKIMAVYGSSDPWYALRINDVYDKPNIKIYVSNESAHGALINNLPESQIAEAWATLDSWLTQEPDIPDVPPIPEVITETAATSDTTNVAISFLMFMLLLSLTTIVTVQSRKIDKPLSKGIIKK